MATVDLDHRAAQRTLEKVGLRPREARDEAGSHLVYAIGSPST